MSQILAFACFATLWYSQKLQGAMRCGPERPRRVDSTVGNVPPIIRRPCRACGIYTISCKEKWSSEPSINELDHHTDDDQ